MDVDSYVSGVRLCVRLLCFRGPESECKRTSPLQDLFIPSVCERLGTLFSFPVCVRGDPAKTPTLLNVSRRA